MQTPSKQEFYLILEDGSRGKTVSGTRIFLYLGDALDYLRPKLVRNGQLSSWSGYQLYLGSTTEAPKRIKLKPAMFGLEEE